MIEPDQRAERVRHRGGRIRDRGLEVLYDAADVSIVFPPDAVDLLDEAAVFLHEPRIERVLLVEPVEVLHRDADVQIVRAGLENVAARTRRLVRDDRIDVRVEEERRHPREHRVEGFAVAERESRSRVQGRMRRGGELLRGALEDELARGQVVVRSRVQPEQLRVAGDFRERRGIHAGAVGEHFLEDVAHLEVVRVALVVKNVASGKRRLVQVPDQDLVVERQLVEAVGIHLHDRRIVDAFEQVAPGVDRRRDRGRHRPRRPVVALPAGAGTASAGTYMRA